MGLAGAARVTSDNGVDVMHGNWGCCVGIRIGEVPAVRDQAARRLPAVACAIGLLITLPAIAGAQAAPSRGAAAIADLSGALESAAKIVGPSVCT